MVVLGNLEWLLLAQLLQQAFIVDGFRCFLLAGRGLDEVKPLGVEVLGHEVLVEDGGAFLHQLLVLAQLFSLSTRTLQMQNRSVVHSLFLHHPVELPGELELLQLLEILALGFLGCALDALHIIVFCFRLSDSYCHVCKIVHSSEVNSVFHLWLSTQNKSYRRIACVHAVQVVPDFS